MKYTAQQIADAAERSCFYVTPDGLWLRILYCDMDDGYFQGLDEDSGEEYAFYFNEMEQEGEDPEFHELTRVVL